MNNNDYKNSELSPILPVEPSSEEKERFREETKVIALESECESDIMEMRGPKEGLHFHRCGNCGEYECPDDAVCFSPEKLDCYECRNNYA